MILSTVWYLCMWIVIFRTQTLTVAQGKTSLFKKKSLCFIICYASQGIFCSFWQHHDHTGVFFFFFFNLDNGYGVTHVKYI